jgi:histidinol-phosphate/aromatic aminotransferase/cobyric acid decarboxylase-like protein
MVVDFGLRQTTIQWKEQFNPQKSRWNMNTIETAIADHKVVSREEWLEARKELLKKEKESTRLRDQLSAEH